MNRGAIAEIDLSSIAHNFGVIREITGGRHIIAVVKADAYGHGAAEVSKRLVREGAYCLAVAFIDEAIKLRDAGISSRILVMFDKQDLSCFFEYSLVPVVHDLQTAVRLSVEAEKRRHKLDVHIKVDTGMGRLGFNTDNIKEDIRAVAGLPYINISGLMSHFSNADISDMSQAEEQLGIFDNIREDMVQSIKNNFLCHIANSAATISFQKAHMDAVRPGLMVYGYSPVDSQLKALDLRPAMRIKTRILSLRNLKKGTPVSYGGAFITQKDSLIAVISAGYADGYDRSFSNNADVLVRGKRAPVAGRVCMDLTMIDVTQIEGVSEGDEVVLLGRQGTEEITAKELALRANTISYEILTSLGQRSAREYKNTGVKVG